MKPMTYTPEEQERLIRQSMPTAAYRLGCLLGRKQREIVDLAVHRGITLGVGEYGDESFHKNLFQLEQETWEELADGVFYQAIYNLKERGVIP